MLQKKCIECGQWLSFEEFTYGHDCEVVYEKDDDDNKTSIDN